jgi:hypothetical protein
MGRRDLYAAFMPATDLRYRSLMRKCAHSTLSSQERIMLDIVFLGLALGLMALMAVYATALDRA